MDEMILFRADANNQIGLGHIMRCISIARALRKVRIQSVFVTADENAKELIKNAGFREVSLNTNYKDLLNELNKIEIVLKIIHPRLIVIDSYFVTYEYFKKLREYVPIAYIDDVGASAYPVDIIINYSFQGDINRFNKLYRNIGEKLTQFWVGIEYAPLREEFVNKLPKKISQNIYDILILAGGSDPEKVLLNFAQQITRRNKEIYRYHFVVGALCNDISDLKKLECSNSNIIIHYKENNIARLMEQCDLAISAAGTTLFELCACGVPAIIYTEADNQLPAIEKFTQRTLTMYVGDCRSNKNFFIDVFNKIDLLSTDTYKRTLISNKMQQLIDGNGAARIAERILQFINC